ncbi:MAG TPA: substrate-binding domain-containing protein [Cytophagaceae bacterium]|nr:substrate-binding domain-containing protein [Cytophagaceae bacterium]
MLKQAVFFFFCTFIFHGCSNKNQIQKVGQGKLMVSADESFKPLLEAEKRIFEAIYNKAEVAVAYKSESEALNDLFKDSVEVIVIGRDLNGKEKDFFKQKNFPIVSGKICSDGIAFIVREDFPDSVLKFNDLQKIFRGEIREWSGINKSLPDLSIQIILDQSNSSNLQALNNSLTINLQSLNIFAAGSNKAATEYVRNNKNALGIIGSSWISDWEDAESRQLLKGLKVLLVQKGDTVSGPYQADLGKFGYPFSRDIYMITSNKKVGAGTAFVSFVASDRGQRIVLKSGLLPATMPGREINIKQ